MLRVLVNLGASLDSDGHDGIVILNYVYFRYDKQWDTITNKPTINKDKSWYDIDADVVVSSEKKLISAKQHYLSVARYVTGRASKVQAVENE